ncbi:MAG: HNH endonuclease signature motif containing protein [Sulfuritalea sp.]|nr:HNH endonuclease signature motif containing protein [Sulfuritalea sp.]
MSLVQHKEAQRVLQIIRDAHKEHGNLNYGSVARKLGRDPKTNSRTVAQVCDLLDAAAAYAGVPLLALVKVKNASDIINPMAWKKNVPAGIRNKIIERSVNHSFTESDFDAIENSLVSLEGLGNRRAWERVKKLRPDLWEQLSAPPFNPRQDAIDDFGSDEPDQHEYSGAKYARDPKVRDEVLADANGRCEYCKEIGFLRPNGTAYLETHHIIALASDGVDRVSNVIAVCPSHHREAHFGARRTQLERELILLVKERDWV